MTYFLKSVQLYLGGVSCARFVIFSEKKVTLCHYYQEGKYTHLKRSSDGKLNPRVFCLELDDDDGSILYLAGQMVAFNGYQWSEGIEPVLMQTLNGISICKT